MFNEEELTAILSEDKIFDEKIWSAYRLKNAAQAHPDRIEALAYRFFNKPRIKFLVTDDDLEYLLEIFPQRKNDIVELLTKVLVNKSSFTNFTYNLDSLLSLQKLLPKEAEKLIKLILQNYFYFDRIIRNTHQFFFRFIKEFPRLKAFLVNLIVENPIESHDEFLNLPSRFEMLFESSYSVKEIFSNNALTLEEKNKLTQIILDTDIEFDRIFAGDFFRFKSFLISLVQDTVRLNHIEELTKPEINIIYFKILNNNLEYSFIDHNGKLIGGTIAINQEQKEDDRSMKFAILQDLHKNGYLQLFSLVNKFLNLLLTYPSSFEKLINSDESFQRLKVLIQELRTANILPLNSNEVLNKPNRLEALKLIRKNYAEIRRSARAIWQGKSEDQNSPVNKLPPEILASIICYTRDPAISEADAYKIALKYLTQPILFIDNIDELEFFTKKLHQHRDEFADEILSSVATYKRIIRSNDDLKRFADLFPDRADTFRDIDDYKGFGGYVRFHEEQAKKDYLEIRKNARVLGQSQSARDPQHASFFAKLPSDILKKIIIESRPEREISDEKSKKLADEFLKKPKP